ncbi:MAG: sialate O-acetylesterase [Verrucomicrobiota bacterium]|nr:sialate O-acetylesterase [Verrucomicrobiota bacterium]
MKIKRIINCHLIFFSSLLSFLSLTNGDESEDPLKVFIFAGQSNMVGSDSNVKDIQRFPPFIGLESAQENVRFAYSIGREKKFESDGWQSLSPVNNVVGPELSFARMVSAKLKSEIAIIKCAAGGTHLGGDWNPENPTGFKMYPLSLKLVKSSLAELDRMKIKYQIEGFMWHQGENDMFNEDYMKNYGKNLEKFLAQWRQDLGVPDLKFFIGELCTKTIWGMDLRPRMYAISKGQRLVTDSDPLAEYVPTSHIGVEIGGGVGLHYHYGTLGQLEHGINYAEAYLKSIGRSDTVSRLLKKWPYKKGELVRLFVLAGHRNMEGERAFVQELREIKDKSFLESDNPEIAYKYSLGGSYHKSKEWEPLGLTGYYDSFGPELSFGSYLQKKSVENIAIAKFTHSGSQIVDWTPEGSLAKSRNLYDSFINFVKNAIQDLNDKGHAVSLEGVFYHVGENDMSFSPHRNNAAKWLSSIIDKSRDDLKMPSLKWYLSQQPPTDDKSVNGIDITSKIEALASSDDSISHLKAFNLVPQEKKLVISTAGIIQLGELIADNYLNNRK